MISAKQARLISSTIEQSNNLKLAEEVICNLSKYIEKEANHGNYKLCVIYNEKDKESHWLVNKHVLDAVSNSLKVNGYSVNLFENQIDGLYIAISW